MVLPDGGYAEIFQYMKELAVVLMLSFFYWRRKAFIYLGWGILFLFLLLDDSLQIHENLGETASKLINITYLGGIRGQDIGEMVTFSLILAYVYSHLQANPHNAIPSLSQINI